MDVDLGDDGSVEWQWTYRFDHRGLLITAEGLALFGGRGHPQMRYYYDDAGQLSTRLWFGDPRAPAISAITYRYVGARLAQAFTTAEGGSLTQFTWEEDRLVRTEERRLGDGDTRIQISTWEAGRLLTTHVDSNGDGRADTLMRYTYDAAGHIDGRTFDNGLDGTVERTEAEVWGADGRLAERQRDTDADGRVDDRFALTWKCPSGT